MVENAIIEKRSNKEHLILAKVPQEDRDHGKSRNITCFILYQEKVNNKS